MLQIDAVSGDIIETPEGRRYLVLPNEMLVYLGNKHLERSEGLIPRTSTPCKVLGRVSLPPYIAPGDDDHDFEPDWDLLRARERIPIPLPNGCTCDRSALMCVVGCNVHVLKIR